MNYWAAIIPSRPLGRRVLHCSAPHEKPWDFDTSRTIAPTAQCRDGNIHLWYPSLITTNPGIWSRCNDKATLMLKVGQYSLIRTLKPTLEE